MYVLHVTSPYSKGINRVFKYINYRTVRNSKLVHKYSQYVPRNTGGRDCPHNQWGKALEGIVTKISANAFTINIISKLKIRKLKQIFLKRGKT